MVQSSKPAKKKGGRPPKVGQGLWEEKPQREVKRARAEISVPAKAEVTDPPDQLSKEQRELFARLLEQEMPLEERVKQLVSLARLNDTKRAPVGLRAIQEINAITGVHDPKPQESPPMFVFPEGTNVSLTVEKIER